MFLCFFWLRLVCAWRQHRLQCHSFWYEAVLRLRLFQWLTPVTRSGRDGPFAKSFHDCPGTTILRNILVGNSALETH